MIYMLPRVADFVSASDPPAGAVKSLPRARGEFRASHEETKQYLQTLCPSSTEDRGSVLIEEDTPPVHP